MSITNLTEIKLKADIVEIISQSLVLKKAGANYQAPCPFHNEKSASFIVSPQKQIWTCFGCGKSGDVFKFIQEHKNLSFYEAVEEVAECVGVSIIYDKAPSLNKAKAKDMSEKYKTLLLHAQKELLAQSQVAQYMRNRGLNDDDFERFGIGYMPKAEVIKSIFSNDEALSLGVLKKRMDGALYTPFKGRVVFALYNGAHKIVGLSGRTHPYGDFKNAPKYINSSESYLFKKSENLYLLSMAKSHIKEQKRAIIVEGYMDTIALHKLGYKNAVATCGTSFNLNSINQIYRIEPNVEFALCFDRDEAGAKATIKALELLFAQGFYNVKVLRPKGDFKDIGEILEKGEVLEFREWLGLEFFIKYKLKTAPNTKAKDELLKELKAMVEAENNYFAKDELLNAIVSITKIQREFFTQKSQTSANPKTLGFERILRFLHGLYNNDDFAYLAKADLDLESIPEYLRADLSAFLERGELKGEGLKIALDERLRADFSMDGFYNEMLSLNITQAQISLQKAKIDKDIPTIIALSDYIEKTRREICNKKPLF